MMTPAMTQHARERCAEMGISTKVAKRIWRTRTTVYPGNETAFGTRGVVVFSEAEPRYIIVTDHAWMEDSETRPVVITVAFRSTEPYRRDGKNFIQVAAQ